MPRQHVNFLGTPKSEGSNPITLATATTTTWSLVSKPATMPASASATTPLVVTVDPFGTREVIWITHITATGKTGTCLRHQETTTAHTHTSKPWVHAPTALDFKILSTGQFVTSTNATLPGTPHLTKVASTVNGKILKNITSATATLWPPGQHVLPVITSVASFPTSGTIVVTTSAGTAVIHYTGKTGTTKLTGCTYTRGSTTGTATVATNASVGQNVILPGANFELLRSATLQPGTYLVNGNASLTNAGASGGTRVVSLGIGPSLTGSPATVSTPLPAATVRTVSVSAGSRAGVLTVSGRITVTAAGTIDLIVNIPTTLAGQYTAVGHPPTAIGSGYRSCTLTIRRVS